MQKIIKQNLTGDKESANAEAEYTWSKDEIAFYFCTIYNDVFKVKFTGGHWLAGNKWGWNKIYEFEYLECSNPKNNRFEFGTPISLGKEHIFYDSKAQAVAMGLRHLKRLKEEAEKDFATNTAKLLAYRKLKQIKEEAEKDFATNTAELLAYRKLKVNQKS